MKCAYERAAGSCDLFHAAGTLLDDCEFIPAQTRGESAQFGCLAQPLRNALQHEISERVSHAVVDILEIVEVEKEYAHLCAVACRVLDGNI